MSNFCDALLYLKNSRKIRKICTTPKFKLILSYGQEHVCTKFGENLLTQTWVIMSTRVQTGHFCDPYCTKKILEKSGKYVRPPNSNSSFVMVYSMCVQNLVKIHQSKLKLSCPQAIFTFFTFVTLTFDLGSQNIAEDTSFLITFHVVKFQNPTPMGKAWKGRYRRTDWWMDGHVRLL